MDMGKIVVQRVTEVEEAVADLRKAAEDLAGGTGSFGAVTDAVNATLALLAGVQSLAGFVQRRDEAAAIEAERARMLEAK